MIIPFLSRSGVSATTLYGASELKPYINRATLRGFGAAVSLLVVLFLGYGALALAKRFEMPRAVGVSSVKLSQLPPPPAETEPITPPPPTLTSGPAARAGTPVPVPDALITPEMKDFANVEDVSRASSTGGDGVDTGLLGLAKDVEVEVREEEPDPWIFVPAEKDPYIDIKDLQKRVVYPELAKRAGIEGRVAVRVLIGKNGVPKRFLVEASDSDLLNDAAVKAVMSSVFTPAIQNNQPIDCWVSVPIVFRLR
jgi:protein TonB